MTSLLQDPRNSRTGAGQSVGESSWSRPAGADSLLGLGRRCSPGRSRVLWEQLFRASPASPTGRGAHLSAHQPHLAVAGLSKFGFQLAGTLVRIWIPTSRYPRASHGAARQKYSRLYDCIWKEKIIKIGYKNVGAGYGDSCWHGVK